jgi:hypothetical protein
MILRAARLLGALSILTVGGVHLQQYVGANYSVVPTIGTLFLLNAIGSAVVGLGLLVPLGLVLGEKRSSLAIGVLAAAGAAIAVGSLVALFISESGALFGFSEYGYRTVIVVTIVAEAVATLILAPLAAVCVARTRPRAGRPLRPARRGRQPGYAASRSAWDLEAK